MALTPKTFSDRRSIVRCGTIAVVLPLFLAACGGANTAASSTS